eukprot:6212258-Ditylum_brightwellii.AAC.1
MFKSRTPTNKEVAKFPKVYITGQEWDSTSNSIYLYGQSQEAKEMRLIHALPANQGKAHGLP